jgi:hypothetical protein
LPQASAKRFRSMAPSSGLKMSAIPPLSGNKQTSGQGADNDA